MRQSSVIFANQVNIFDFDYLICIFVRDKVPISHISYYHGTFFKHNSIHLI